VAFKFSSEKEFQSAKKDVEKLFKHSNADYIVLNNLYDRTSNGTQINFHLFDKSGFLGSVINSYQLGKNLINLINK
jgi:hypothetical protein